jgi:6-pyruvoyltetrahydropterin/6-carboxytetrahydropterin synthase
MFELKQHFSFEAARKLPFLPETHPCSRLHGHSFKAILTVRGQKCEPVGWVIDYNDIIKAAEPYIKQLDHAYLNEVKGLENPTTENITQWLFECIKKHLPELTKVTVMETPQTECSFPAL